MRQGPAVRSWSPRGFVGVLVGLLTAGCASDDPWKDVESVRPGPVEDHAVATSPERGREREPALTASNPLLGPRVGDPVLLRVGARDVHASELTDAFFFFAHAQTSEILRKLVEEHLVRLEATRLGVTVEVEAVDRGVEEFLARFERELRESFGDEIDVDVYLREELLTDRPTYVARVRRYVALGGLRDRVIRCTAARRTRYEVRVLTVASEDTARRAWNDLRQGADFAVLHAGLVPAGRGPREGRWPLLPATYDHPIVRAVSELSGPGLAPVVRERREGQSLWHVVELLATHAAVERPYGELAGAIQEELERRPVTRDEYLLWLTEVRDRHPIERLRP